VGKTRPSTLACACAAANVDIKAHARSSNLVVFSTVSFWRPCGCSKRGPRLTCTRAIHFAAHCHFVCCRCFCGQWHLGTLLCSKAYRDRPSCGNHLDGHQYLALPSMRMRAQHRLQQRRRARPWSQRQLRWVHFWPPECILPAFFLLNACSRRHILGTCSSVAGAYKCRRRRSLCIYSALVGADRCCCRRRLYTCFSPSGARRCRCRRSLCTCSALVGADRCCRRRRLYTCSSPSGARRGRCRRSLCNGSSAAGARRGHCRRSLYTGSSAAGVRTAQGEASWLRKDVAPDLWPCLMHCKGSHHAHRACGAFLVALCLRAPPAFSSYPMRQPPGHECDPTSYFAAYPPCGVCLCSRCGASTLAWCPCLYVRFRSTRPLRS